MEAGTCPQLYIFTALITIMLENFERAFNELEVKVRKMLQRM